VTSPSTFKPKEDKSPIELQIGTVDKRRKSILTERTTRSMPLIETRSSSDLFKQSTPKEKQFTNDDTAEVQWYWQEDLGGWRPYPPVVSDAIEEAYLQGKKTLHRVMYRYTISMLIVVCSNCH
jgi:hypothetical protein